jgi:Mn-dependent DtxR family transcriptional regulator
MTKEGDILKIVREDILRTLGEEETEEVSVDSIKSDINVSDPFISKAIKQLNGEGLIKYHNNFISLTERGKENARDIVKKHRILENYVKETKNGRDAHKVAHILEHYVSKEVIDNIKKLSTLKSAGVPLTELECNGKGIITDIVFSDYGVFERMVSMGIFLGERIRITNEISDSIVIKIGNKKIALNKDIAENIRIYKNERA